MNLYDIKPYSHYHRGRPVTCNGKVIGVGDEFKCAHTVMREHIQKTNISEMETFVEKQLEAKQ